VIAVSCNDAHNMCSFVETVYLLDTVQIAVHLLAKEDNTGGMNVTVVEFLVH